MLNDTLPDNPADARAGDYGLAQSFLRGNLASRTRGHGNKAARRALALSKVENGTICPPWGVRSYSPSLDPLAWRLNWAFNHPARKSGVPWKTARKQFTAANSIP